MISYTNSLSGGLIQPSNMSYVAYSFGEDLVLSWPSTFGNNPKVTAGMMDLTAEEDSLSVILVIEQEERRSISTREEATTMNEQPEGEQTV